MIRGLNDEEVDGRFYKNGLQNKSEIEFRIEKVIKKGFGISDLAAKLDLAGLNVEVGKLKNVPADLSKLSNVVYKYVFKRLCIIKWSLTSMRLMLFNLLWKFNIT